MADNVIRTIAFRGTSEGLDELTNKLREVAAVEKDIALVSDDLSKRQISLAAAWKNTGQRLNETARNLDNFARLMKQNDAALAQTAITAEQHGQRVTELTLKYDKAAISIRKFSEEQIKMGQAANQAIQQAAKAADAAQKRGAELAAINSGAAINQRLGVRDDFGVAQRAKDFEIAAKAADDLRAKYVPLFAAQREYRAKLEEIRQGVYANAMSEKEGRAAIATTTTAFREHVNTLKGVVPAASNASKEMAALTKQSSRNAAEMLNMGRQFADVAVSLQAGQSLLVVGLQQGTQIIDVIASSQRSMGQIFGQAATWAGRFITSTAGVVTGIAAIGGGALLAASSWQEGQREIDKALIGVGKRAGLTRQDINELGETVAKSSRLSASTLRESAVEIIKTGTIYGENVGKIAGLVEGFAVQTGQSAQEATKALAEIFGGDLAQGADKLNAIYGNLSGKTRQYIIDLESAGQRQQAISVLADAMSGSIKKSADTIGFWGARWQDTKNIMDGIIDTAGKMGTALTGIGGTKQQQLGRAERKLGVAEESLAGAEAGGGLSRFSAEADQARAAVAKLREEVDKLKKEIAAGEAEAQDNIAKKIGQDADAAVRALLPFIDQLAAVEKLQNKIKEAQKTPGAEQGLGQYNKQAADAAGILLDKLKQTADETGRANANGLQLKETYGTTTVEAARTLDALKDQAKVAGAVGGAAQMAAQEEARYNQLVREGKDLQDAARIATAERAVTQAQINTQSKEATWNLQNMLPVAQAVGGAAKLAAQEQATYNQLVHNGVSPAQASAQAAAQRAVAQAQINSAAQENLQIMINQRGVSEAVGGSAQITAQALATQKTLLLQGVDASIARATAAEQEYQARARVSSALEEQSILLNQQAEILEARLDGTEKGLKASHAYQNAIRAGASQFAASEMASATQRIEDAQEALDLSRQRAQANRQAADQAAREAAEYRRLKAISDDLLNRGRFVPFFGTPFVPRTASGGDLPLNPQGHYTQFDLAGYESSAPGTATLRAIYSSIYGEGGFDEKTGAPNAQGIENQFNKLVTQAGGNIGAAVGSVLGGGIMTAGSLGVAPAVDEMKLGVLSRAIDLLPKEQQIGSIQSLVGQLGAAPASLHTSELIKQLNDKLEQLTQATDANTSATSAMTDVLSPFYSSDPRKTHLGFRAFAGGGIMSQYGELPLRQYQGGGMATSPQVAVFGEGSTPEAYVPVPSGRIPVEIKQPANSNQRPVNVNIHVHGNADANTVAALKATAFQQAQTMRRVMR